MNRREFVLGGLYGAAVYPWLRKSRSAPGDDLRAFVGTYTQGTASEGLYHCRFDAESGALRIESVTPGLRNPSFLALRPDGRLLYAVQEVDDLDASGSGGVVAYAVEGASAGLRERNRAMSGGAHPAHLSVCARRGRVLVANYTGGSVSVLRLDESGALAGEPRVVQHERAGPARPPRQAAPHPHAVYPVGDRVYVPDLGLDRIVGYGWATGAIGLEPLPHASLALQPGDGPRHMAWHPSADFAYVINELSSTITALHVDRTSGALHAVGTVSTLPEEYAGESYCADIHIHPNGRYLYGTNRGHNSVVVAEISPATGALTVVQHHPTGGSWPRNFALDPSGRFLLVENQRSDTIVTLAIDPTSGRLSETGEVLQIPAPVCLLFAPES